MTDSQNPMRLLSKFAAKIGRAAPQKAPRTPDFKMQLDSRPLEGTAFIAFDVETTGKDVHLDAIVEIGAVRRHSSDIQLPEDFTHLVDPRRQITEEAFEKRCITERMVTGQPLIEDILPRFVRFIGSPDNILVAHNSSFNAGMIGLAMRRCDITFPDHVIVDTMSLAKKLVPRLASEAKPSLEMTATVLGIVDVPCHRALPDAQVTLQVFEKLLDRGARYLRTRKHLFEYGRGRRFSFAPANFGAGARYAALQDLVTRRVTIQLSLAEAGGTVTRTVTPRWFTREADKLVAYCHDTNQDEYFDLARITQYKKAEDHV